MDKNLQNQCTADDGSVFHKSHEGENESKATDDDFLLTSQAISKKNFPSHFREESHDTWLHPSIKTLLAPVNNTNMLPADITVCSVDNHSPSVSCEADDLIADIVCNIHRRTSTLSSAHHGGTELVETSVASKWPTSRSSCNSFEGFKWVTTQENSLNKYNLDQCQSVHAKVDTASNGREVWILNKEGDNQESCLDKFCNMATCLTSHGSSTLHSNNATRNAQAKGHELEIMNGCDFTATGNLRGNISQPNLRIILDALERKFEAVSRRIEAGFAKFVYSDSPPEWFLKYMEANKLCPTFENQMPHSNHCFSHDKAAESCQQQSFKFVPSEQQAIEMLLQRALTELEVTKGELMKLQSQSSRHTEEISKLKEKYRDLQQVLEHKETIIMECSPQSTLLKNEVAADEAVEVENSLKEDLQKVQDQLSTTVKEEDSILSKTVVCEIASEGERDLKMNPTEDQIVQREEEVGNAIDRVDLLSASVATSALGEWEKHTKGIGSKIMTKLGYVMGSGLGKHGEGRTEPVEAIVLPRGKSLDCCMEIKEKAKGKSVLRVKKRLKRKKEKKFICFLGEQEKKFIKEETGGENHFPFSFDLLKTRTSSGIQDDRTLHDGMDRDDAYIEAKYNMDDYDSEEDNQKMNVSTRSLQSERYELGETVDESCRKISQLGESVLNEEEPLDLPCNMSGAAKSGIVATEHPLSECNTKASSFNQTNIKNLEIATVVQLNKLIRDRLTKTTVSYFIRWLFLLNFKAIDAIEKLDVLFHVLYVKANNEQIWARKYTEVCKLMFEIEVPLQCNSGTGIVSFRKLLLDRCQQTSEKQKKNEEEIASKRKALLEADTEEKKKELQMELEEKLGKLKHIMIGNISFFGEFFKLNMVTIENVNFCISELLKSRTEEHLECLCKFISTIGKTYEEEYDAKYQRAAAEAKISGKQMHLQLTKLDVYLDEMRKLSQSEDLSSRIRLILTEVLDLKRNRWVPHREGEKPNTKEEIRDGLQKVKLVKEPSLQEDTTKQPQMEYPSQERDGKRGDESKKSNNHKTNALNRSLESERHGLGENIDESCHKIPHFKESVLNEEEALNLPSIRRSASKSGIVAAKSTLSKSNTKASSLTPGQQTNIKNLEIAIVEKLNLKRLMHDGPKKTVNDLLKMVSKGFKKIDAEKKLDVLVHILYAKATDKPICALEYAKLCKLISERGPMKVGFRQFLLNRCQQNFEKQMKGKEETVSILKALQEAGAEEKKAILLVKLNKRKEEEKRNLLGNVRFTSELFKLRILKIEVMNFFLSELLRSRTEEHLECLCELVSTIGKTYEEESNGYHQVQVTNLDFYLDEMRKLSLSADLSSPTRFMLIDVLKLKERAWMPLQNEEYCRQSPSLSGNQEVKAPIQSLELERYELGGTIDESCQKVSKLGQSVLNQEEVLNRPSIRGSAAKSGIVATAPALSECNTRAIDLNQTNTKNLKIAIVPQLNRLICDSPKKMDVSNFTEWLFHLNFKKIDAENKIDVLVHILYVKAIEKPLYAPKLAEVLKLMSEKEVHAVTGRGKVSLCQLILNRCQQTFEKHINSKEEILSKQEASQEAETEEKKAELLVKLDERIAKEKQVLLGFIRFTGELFNSKLLKIEVMDFCISELLKLRTEGQLECLCELLSLIGKTYEQEYDAKYRRAVTESENTSQPLEFQLTKLDVYVDEMRKICEGKSTDVSSRIRVMLIDVLDLKQRAWIPHKSEANCQQSLSLFGQEEKSKRDRSLSKTDDS